MLKIVYFGPMEVKVLVYILVGVLWLFSKLLKMKKPVQEAAPRTADTNSGKIESPGSSPVRTRRFSTEKSRARLPVSLENEKGLERLSGLESPEPYAHSIATDSGLAPDLSAAPFDAAGIADEIRNGDIDWKRAVVINELLFKKVV
jgi:hypothetical protein